MINADSSEVGHTLTYPSFCVSDPAGKPSIGDISAVQSTRIANRTALHTLLYKEGKCCVPPPASCGLSPGLVQPCSEAVNAVELQESFSGVVSIRLNSPTRPMLLRVILDKNGALSGL